MFSRFILVMACITITCHVCMAEFHYFIRLNNISLHVATAFYFFIHHSSIDRYLGYFYFGAIMNRVVMNIG